MRSLFFKIFLWFWVAQILIGAALYLLAAATQRGFDERLTGMAGSNLEARAQAAAVAYETGGLPALREAWRLPVYNRADNPGAPDDHDRPDENDGDNGGPPPGRDPEERGSSRQDAKRRLTDRRAPDGDDPERRGPRGGGPDDISDSSFYALKGPVASLTPVLLAGPPQPAIFTRVVPGTFLGNEAVTVRKDGLVWLARRITTQRGGRYMAVAALRFPRGVPGGVWGPWFQAGPGQRPGSPWRFAVIVLVMGMVCYALARYLADPAIKLRRVTQEFAGGNLAARIGPSMGRRRDELADLGRDFDLMAERIESLRISERRLLGDISHELRSPLARLQVALDLAGQTADKETREYLDRIEEEAEELKAMIGQLLTLTRLENAATDYRISDIIDLAQMIEQVSADADFEAKSRDGHVEVLESAPCRMMGNGQLLRSAIENVVRNAIVHTEEGSRIEVRLHVAAQTASITVRDYGPGVPPEALQEVFRPFYRVAEGRERQSGGVGLGLSITQRAVQLHGGTVSAANAPGGGLLVTISLPLTAASQDSSKA